MSPFLWSTVLCSMHLSAWIMQWSNWATQAHHFSTSAWRPFCTMKASEGAWHDKAIKKHLCPHPEFLPHNQPFPPLFNRQNKLKNIFRRKSKNPLYFLLQLENFQRKKGLYYRFENWTLLFSNCSIEKPINMLLWAILGWESILEEQKGPSLHEHGAFLKEDPTDFLQANSEYLVPLWSFSASSLFPNSFYCWAT